MRFEIYMIERIKINILVAFVLLWGIGADAQKRKVTKPAPKTAAPKPVVERKPKTAVIDSLIANYHFDEAADVIDEELDAQPNADYAAILKARSMQAEKGSNMLEATQKVVFIDSQVVSREHMLQAISIDKSCGRLLTAKQVKEMLGTKEQPTGIGFVNDFGDHIVYSQNIRNGGTKLMQANRFGDSWSSPTPLQGIGDSLSTEGFPFMMADGTTFYFAAKDEGSLGGYDIYVTRYDSEDNAYLRPENVGMPFNSPANDYLMVFDEVNNMGWFVSDRNQPADKVCIYTFIPSDTRNTYSEISEQQLRTLAALNSITASQQGEKKAVDEALLRLKNARTASTDVATNTDLNFDVAYGKRYNSLDDFHNKQAKEMAAEWAVQKFRRVQLANLLSENRKKFAGAHSETERKALAPVILRQEDELAAQDIKLAEMANKVRSLENN